MKSSGSCAFEFELLLVFKLVYNVLSYFCNNGQNIHIHADVLIDITVLMHSNVWITLEGVKPMSGTYENSSILWNDP